MDTIHGIRCLRLVLLAAAFGLLSPATLSAQGKGLPPELAVVPQDAAAFVQIRPADLWHGTSFGGQGVQKLFPKWADEVSRSLGDDPAETESFSIVLPSAGSPGSFFPLMSGMESSDPLLFVETTVKPMQEDRVVERLFGAGAVKKQHLNKTYWLPAADANGLFRDGALFFVSDRTYLYATAPAVMPVVIEKASQPRKNGPLTAAFEAATKGHQFVAGVNLTEPGLQKQIKKLAADLEPPFGRRRSPFRDLPFVEDVPPWLVLPLLSAQSASFSIEVQKENRLRINSGLTFASRAQAEAAGAALDDLLVLLRVMVLGKARGQLTRDLDYLEDREGGLFLIMLLQQAEDALRSTGASVDRKQATVRLRAEGQFDLAYLRGKAKIAAENFVESDLSRRVRYGPPIATSLRRLTWAMHDYLAVSEMFPPPAICGKDGKPLLSWRVAILPNLGEKKLFDEFKLDEPWDSAHNIKLLPRMPKVYASPHLKTKEPHTLYQVLVGPGTVFELVPDRDSKFGAKGARVYDMLQRARHIVAVVEGAVPVPWTKPQDLTFDPNKPLPAMGGTLADGFLGTSVDGTVRFIKLAKPGLSPEEAEKRGEVSEESLRAAIVARSGKESLGSDWWALTWSAPIPGKQGLEFSPRYYERELKRPPMPKHIAAAWEKAGAKSGWLVNHEFFGPGRYSFEEREGARGALPAFAFFHQKDWKAGSLRGLPVPEIGFGLAVAYTPLNDEDLKDIGRMKSLRMLELVQTDVTDDGIKELAGLKSLTLLQMRGAKLTGAGLAGLTSLEILDLNQSKVTNEGLEPLAGMKSLTHLFLDGTKVTGAGLKHVGELKSLRTLTLNGGKITDADLKELAGLTSLESFALDGTKVTGTGFAHLAGLKSLRSLSLNDAKVNDAGMKELAKLPSLQTLNLNRTRVTDAGVKELEALQSLEFLRLCDAALTDEGLKHLSKLKSLRNLIIEYTDITDAGMKVLAQIPSLQWIDIDGTNVSKEAVAEFRKARPRVTVEIFFREGKEKIARRKREPEPELPTEWTAFAQEIPVGKPAQSAEVQLTPGRDLVALRQPDWEVDGDVETMALSPDCNFLAIGDGKRLSVWDVRTGKKLASLEPPRGVRSYGFPARIIYAADGSLLAVSDYGKIYVFDAKTGRMLQELGDEETGAGRPMSFGANANTLISVTDKGVVCIWDVKKGTSRTLKSTASEHIYRRDPLALSPDGKTIAYASEKALSIIDLHTGAVKQTRPLDKDVPRCLAFSPDGKHLAVGKAKSVDVLSTDNLNDKVAASLFTSLEPAYVAWSPSGNSLVAACEYGDIYLLNPKDEKQPTRYHIDLGFKRIIPVFARNGKTLLAATNKTISVWDFEVGAYERMVPQKRIWALAGDGRGETFATAGEDGVTVFDWKTGSMKRALPGIHAMALALDPTGKFLAHRQEGPVQIYDLDKGTSIDTGSFKPAKIKFLGDQIRPEDQPLAWSPDGKTLAGGEGRMVKLFRDGKARVLGDHRHNVLSLAWSADGKWLASGGADGRIAVWDLTASTRKWDLDAHEKGVKCLSFSADGGLLASGGTKDDPSVSIWDLAEGKEKLHWSLHEASSSLMGSGISGLAFSPDAKHLAVTRGRAIIEIYDAATGKLYRTSPAHTSNPFGSNESMVDLGAGRFASFEDSKVLLWSWERLLSSPLALPSPPRLRPPQAPPAFATLLRQEPVDEKARYNRLSYSPDGKVLALIAEKEVRLIEPAGGKTLRLLTADKRIHQAVFSADGKLLATANEDKSIRIYDLANGQLVKQLTGQHVDGPATLTFAQDGGMIVSGISILGRNELIFWDVKSGEVKQKFMKDETKAARSLATLPGGNVVAALADGKVQFWDVKTFTVIKTIEARKNAAIIVLSADGKRLACAEHQDILGIDGGIRDAKIWVWDVDTGKVLGTIADTGTQNYMAFGPDGNSIYTVGGDTSKGFSSDYLQVWDIAAGKVRGSLSHFHLFHNELFGSRDGVSVTAFTFSPDGKTLATYAKTELRFWKAADLADAALQKGMAGVIRHGGTGQLRDGMLYVSVPVHGRNSAAALDRIASLPYPVTLSLPGSAFMSDGELVRIKSAANIKHLDLSGAVFLSDAGLKQVAALTGLESLRLDAPYVTDAGIEHLQQLRHLKKLYLFESGSSPAGIERLKKALPSLQVVE